MIYFYFNAVDKLITYKTKGNPITRSNISNNVSEPEQISVTLQLFS